MDSYPYGPTSTPSSGTLRGDAYSAGQTKPVSALDSILSEQSKCISDLSMIIDRLHDRLKPVLTPQSPSEALLENAKIGPIDRLSDKLVAHNIRISNHARDISLLIERLEI